MTVDHLERLVAAAQALASLEGELREQRAVSDDKALIRRVLGHMERARSELEKAIGAGSVGI